MTLTSTTEPSTDLGTPAPERSGHWAERLGPGTSRGWDEGWLDGVRAVAVLLVVMFHVWLTGGSPHPRVLGHDLVWLPVTLGVGVTLFFLLSGFLLARPWFVAEARGAPMPSVRRFYVRRIKRIVPAYYLSLALMLIVFVPSGDIPVRAVTGEIGLQNLGGHLLFLQGFLPVSSGNLNGTNGVYWTLTVEMTLYLLLPLLALAFLGRRWIVAVPAALAVSLAWVWLTRNALDGVVRTMLESIGGETWGTVWVSPTEARMRDLLALSFPAWLFNFALGIGLAKLTAVHAHRVTTGQPTAWWASRTRGAASFGVGVVGLLTALYLVGTAATSGHTQRFWTHYMWPIVPSLAMAVALFGLAFGPAALRRPLQWLPMRYLGWIGYGVYLTHVPVLLLIRRYTDLEQGGGARTIPLLMAVALPAVVVLGTISWLLVERPLLGRASRRARRAQVMVLTGLLVVVLAACAVVARTEERTGDPRLASGGLFAEAVTGGRIDGALSGRTTVGAALRRGLLYPFEAEALRRCGARDGSTSVIVTSLWSVSASAFECRSAEAAIAARDRLMANEATIGYAETGAPDPGTALFFRGTDPPTPTHPAQFHVRRSVDGFVVGMAIQARTEDTGRQAVPELLGALDERLQPGSAED